MTIIKFKKSIQLSILAFFICSKGKHFPGNFFGNLIVAVSKTNSLVVIFLGPRLYINIMKTNKKERKKRKTKKRKSHFLKQYFMILFTKKRAVNRTVHFYFDIIILKLQAYAISRHILASISSKDVIIQCLRNTNQYV